MFDPFTVVVCSCKSKWINKNSDNPTTVVKSFTLYNIIIKKQNVNDILILVALTESVRSCRSKYVNTKYMDNIRDEILLHIRNNNRQQLYKNCKMVTKNKIVDSYRDEISDTTNKDTKEKESRIANSHIKIYISLFSILSYLSLVNSTNQKSISSPVLFILVLTNHNFENST